MWRVCPSLSVIVGRLAWKSKNSSGSSSATTSASSEPASVSSAVEAAAAASFQPRNAQTRTGERSSGTSPSQRSASIRFSLRQCGPAGPEGGVRGGHQDRPMEAARNLAPVPRPGGPDRRRADARAELPRPLRVRPQGPPDGAQRLPLPGARAARPQRLDPGAGLPRGRPDRRPLRARRRGRGQGPGGALPRPAQRRARGRPQARSGRGRPGRVPPLRLPRPRGAGGLPRAPDPRGPRRRASRRRRAGALHRACRGRVPARAVHARRAPRLPRRPARAHGRGRHARNRAGHPAPAPRLRPADGRGPASTTPARRASSPTAPRSG